MNRTLHLWLGLAALFLAAVALPVAAQKGQQAFTETTEVVVVEIPVQVVRDGQPVRGLTVNDFEVFDGRKKQEIVGFEVLDLTAPASPQQPQLTVPAAARRHFLMLFDLTFSEPRSIVQARKAARDVVDELHPTDLVAVATYSSSNGPQLILGFTPDRQQITTAVETLGAPKLAERTADPLRLVVSETASGLAQSQGLRGNTGTEQQQEVRASREEAVAEYVQAISEASARANRANQEKLVTALTRSFADLAKLMSSVEGRKYVVYLSEGFDSSLASGAADQTRQQELSDSALSGEVWNVNSDEKFGSTAATNDIEKMLEEFRRADCVIQAVDIGGLRGTDGGDAPKRASGRDSLFQMAKDTGGEMYENFNDLSAAMGQMLQRTGVTYVLAIQPEKLKLDGAYRKLKVELKGAAGKGARVVHRPGYYAPKPYTAQSPLEKLLQTANQLTSGEESGTVASSVLAAPFRISGDKAYVPVVIEIDGPSFLGQTTGTTLPVEIYIYALDDTGAVHDFVTQTFGLDLAKAAPALRQSGVKFFGDLDLLPGSYSLRVLVRNGVTGATSLRVVPLEVPSFAKGDTALLPPFFPEPPGRWLMTRENQEPGQPQKPYPFMQKDQPFIPASKPVLTAGQEAAVSLVAYNLGAGDLKTDVKVMTLDGKDAGTGQIRVLSREGGGAAGPDRLAATFRPPTLQPGEYVLQVTVSNAEGKAETSTTRFVVGGAGRGAAG